VHGDASPIVKQRFVPHRYVYLSEICTPPSYGHRLLKGTKTSYADLSWSRDSRDHQSSLAVVAPRPPALSPRTHRMTEESPAAPPLPFRLIRSCFLSFASEGLLFIYACVKTRNRRRPKEHDQSKSARLHRAAEDFRRLVARLAAASFVRRIQRGI
jgi:hypothetical protein